MDDNGNALISWVQEEAVGNCGNVAGCQQAYLSEYRGGSWDHPSDTDDPWRSSSKYIRIIPSAA